MNPIIIIESSPHSVNGTAYTCVDCPIDFYIVSGITDGILVSYEWYLVRSGISYMVSIGSGYTLTDPQVDDDIYVKVINCNGEDGTSGINGTSGTSGIDGTSGTSGTSGINGTSGTSGINGTSGTSGINGTSGTSGIDGTSGLLDATFTDLTDWQIIIRSGNTWKNSNKMVQPGSFDFHPSTGVMSYETPEIGHYEIVIFGSDENSGLTNVNEGDTLVYSNGYWVNKNANCYEYIDFYFSNITQHTFYVDLKAQYNYNIVSIILNGSESIQNTQLLINNNPITWIDYSLTSMLDITTGITESVAYSDNTVYVGDFVTLSGVTNLNSVVQGKIKIIKTDCIAPITTTTTTYSGSSEFVEVFGQVYTI